MRQHQGFALIVTLSLMILLTVIAVGLLTLSSIALRSTSVGSAQATARANARLGLQLALAELQSSAGDDRRVTANGSIFDGAAQPQVTGVWKSWSPKLSKNTNAGRPDYDEEKNIGFVRWLVSGDEENLINPDWAKTEATGERVKLFRPESSGFLLEGAKVDVKGRDGIGALAWAVSQEATKAKLTVKGPEEDSRVANDDLQAQPRPSLAVGTFFNQPDGNWNQRAGQVLGFNQVKLDQDLWNGDQSLAGGDHFTAVGAGLLTNVVDGGLKTDMSLGFEMDDGDFAAGKWSSDGASFTNPFSKDAETEFSTPGIYKDQRPLYKPLSNSGTLTVPRSYDPASVQFDFPVTAVPTFESLRSFYRIPHHLYQTADGITVFERENDHVSVKAPRMQGGYKPPPSKTMNGSKTQLGIRPVLDRAMFLISMGLSSVDELKMVMTPVVTLWNPYNTALEIEGAVAYIWIDMPYTASWKVFDSRGSSILSNDQGVANLMGYQFLYANPSHGRSVNPYFYAAITADGQPIKSGTPKPIRFEPGEVRVFMPASQTLTEYKLDASVRQRTIFLRPVDSLDQYSTKGGLAVPTNNRLRNSGFTHKLLSNQTAQFTFRATQADNYPFYISLEDATRAKGSNPAETNGGLAISEVLADSFVKQGEIANFDSPQVTYATLKREPRPVGVLEAYHKVAKKGSTAQVSDLVFTGNPRQPWMNPFVSNTKFFTGPQYQMRMRATTSFNGVLESDNGGRSAFWGPSQSRSTGKSHLSFFEIPTAPMLSMAGFQHADLSGTSFAPANQVGNSWASAYVNRDRVALTAKDIDHCYLLNEALWDGWFFSGAAPTLTAGSGTGSSTVWDGDQASISRSTATVLKEFFENPALHPLRNPRMIPAGTVADPDKLAASLAEPAGCVKIGSDLMVDGAFNVNSTSVEAWTAVLAGLRGAEMDVANDSVSSGNDTPFPRLRDPVGTANDNWQGYRTLSDGQIQELARNLVDEVRKRGPFQSLAEFVNRRITSTSDNLGLSGALQTAIDNSSLNDAAMQDDFVTTNYLPQAKSNIKPANSGVGIPGYLTQADVLKSLAPVITVRSDTFTIRSYGEARSPDGKSILATAWVEAIVQRVPDFVDSQNKAFTPVSELNTTNAKFGRKFEIVSFRFIPDGELLPKT